MRQSSGFRNTGGSLLFASQAGSTAQNSKNKVIFSMEKLLRFSIETSSNVSF